MTNMAYIGIADPVCSCDCYCQHLSGNGFGGGRVTLLICRQNGSPRSRPKAKTMRDEVARKAIAAQMSMMIIMAIMTEAPDREPVAS